MHPLYRIKSKPQGISYCKVQFNLHPAEQNNYLQVGTFFGHLLIFFSKLTIKKIIRNIIWASISLDPDQARNFVRPDVDPNYLQMLSADDTSRQKIMSSSPVS